MSDRSQSAVRRMARRALVARIARGQAGIVSRPQLYAAGITRHEVRANLRAGRWRRIGSQSVAVHRGELTLAGRHWAAVFEAGPRAFLDGHSALQCAGLEHFDSDHVRVSVPRGARVRRARGLDIRQTRRWRADDLAPGSGVPRTRPEVAAVRAALWARSDKQAALLLTMAVQQGLTTAEGLGRALLRVKRDKRRALTQAVVLDLLGGAGSLTELEVVRECRSRGLPAPSRQVLRRGRGGRLYLDLYWDEWGVVVEVDGIQHGWASNVISDALRHNDVALQEAVVLRLPVLGFRVAREEFFDQIESALVARGWSRPGGQTVRAL
ncbi:MAG: hypothetical protein ACR2K3_09700 [Nocardioides sp.]